MVDVKELTFGKRGKLLLKDMTFSLENGRVTVLLGPNGSGKTTLMRVLSSYYRDYSGSVLMDGKDLRGARKEERQSLHAYLSQTLPSVRFSLHDLLEFSNSRALAESAIGELGLDALEDKLLEEMSGGEKALSYLCLLYSQKAGLYLLDEPDSSLDPRSRKVLDQVIGNLKGRDAAVLVTLHDLNHALQVADDVLVLDKGRLVFSGTKTEFLESLVPETVFGVKLASLKTEEGESLQLFL